MLAWLNEYSVLLTWLSIVSGLMFFGTLLLVPWVIIRMPEDYFVRTSSRASNDHWVMRLMLRIARNVLGWIFILAGIAMLVLPGQGVLTILLGISLTDLPFKQRLEHWIITRPKIQSGLNWIRKKANRPPLQFPDKNNGASQGESDS